MSIKPQYASQVPYVPVNWTDRDTVTGRILEILEAVMPEGRQLDATKNLVKESTKQYWIELFNTQYDELSYSEGSDGPQTVGHHRSPYYKAIWKEALNHIDIRDAQSDYQHPMTIEEIAKAGM